jgi:glycerol-3-phosphate cytidylyltransferase
MVVYTGGTFDLIHPGHIQLLFDCRVLAGPDGQVVVSVNTDDFVRSYKGREPVMTYQDRCAVLQAIRWVDRVIENTGGADSKPAIESVRPDIIAIGEDWKSRDYYSQMQFSPEWLEERGITLVYLGLLDGRSSTGLRQRAQMISGRSVT